MMQHEITTSGRLLDGSGNLREPGYAKRLLPIYRRADIKAPASRIKEWDYYLVANDHFAVALTIDDNGYMGLDSVSFLHFDERWERTKSPMRAFPMGRTGLPESSVSGTTATSGRGYALVFRHVPEGRELTFHMEKFLDGQTIDGSIVLTEEPEESMVICTPFDRPGCFYFNQKINCMRARGQVRLGEKTYVFEPADSFGVLDWGRGVWTYHNTWYWGSASGQVDGVPFETFTEDGVFFIRIGDREYAVLRRQGPQAQPGAVPYPPAGGEGRLPVPLALYLRRRAVRDEVCPHSGPGRLHGREAHQVRPAPGVRALHRNGHTGRRNRDPGPGYDRICGKGGEQVVKSSARSGTEWALWLLWIICPWRKSGRYPHRPGRCFPGRLWPPGPRTR